MRLILRDYGRQATRLVAKHIGKKKNLFRVACVCVRESLHVLNLLSSSFLSLLISLQGELVRMRVRE